MAAPNPPADPSKWLLWLLGVLAAALLSVLTGYGGTLSNLHGRLSTVEAQVHETGNRLERIERKQDAILNRLPAARRKGGEDE